MEPIAVILMVNLPKINDIHKIYLMNFLNQMQLFGAVAVPFFLDWGKINYTQMFLLEAWFMFWIFVLEIPTGIIADRYGRKVSMILSLLCTASSMFIFGLTTDYSMYFVAEFVGAMGVSLMSGACEAWIYDTLLKMKKEKDAKRVMSNYSASSTMAMVVAFPLGSLLVGSGLVQYPYVLALTFILSGVTSLLAFLVMLTVHEPKVSRSSSEGFLAAGLNGLKHIFKHRSLRAFTINSVLIRSVTFFMFWLYQPLLKTVGFDIGLNGFVGAGFNLFGMFLLMNVERLERWFGTKNLLFYTAVIPGLAFISIVVLKGAFLALVGIFLVTALVQLRGPVLSAFMNEHIESKNRATVLSGISMLGRLTTMVLYPVVGFLSDISIDHALAVLGIITLVFAFLTKVDEEHLN